MPEYIEREATLDALRKAHNPNTARMAISFAAVNSVPAADVRPVVRGEWHGSGDGYADGHLVIDEWECPFCGKYFPEWDEKPDWNFCPNCGADMRKEQ